MEIQAEDLRIGNMIHIPRTNQDAEICIISGLGYLAVNKDYIGLGKLTLEDIKPIPLTEEWLIKYKATKLADDELFQISRFQLIWKVSYKYWYVVDAMEKCYMTKIKFVHEFQNFMFAMDGTELTIRLNTIQNKDVGEMSE